jgi:hypothetical protein
LYFSRASISPQYRVKFQSSRFHPLLFVTLKDKEPRDLRQNSRQFSPEYTDIFPGKLRAPDLEFPNDYCSQRKNNTAIMTLLDAIGHGNRARVPFILLLISQAHGIPSAFKLTVSRLKLQNSIAITPVHWIAAGSNVGSADFPEFSGDKMKQKSLGKIQSAARVFTPENVYLQGFSQNCLPGGNYEELLAG